LLGPQRASAELLEQAAALLAPHAPLQAAARGMRGKAERLRESRFTIALFGAFSAGKSSLANALIGDTALPVSPNPTTAAINRIVPPDAEHPHGTARIAMKSRPAMMEDIRYSLALLGEPDDTTDEAALLRRIGALRPDALHPGGRPHYSFLKAVHEGWDAQAERLGGELHVDEAEYRRFVAEEARSCFVQEIDYYYACPLTAQGIVLVDTPGADSVNARHTGVAFNYIKNADAILFVTYYNHAFSQADRQFLLQLGRVKDQFELDKMFFLVNAADLAADDEELEAVLAHVGERLVQHGIRQPRLYPVSSLEAIDAKAAGDPQRLEASGLAAFEWAFRAFTAGELGRLSIEAAARDIGRACDAVADWLASAQGDAASRAARRDRLAEASETALQAGAALLEDAPYEAVAAELSELLHYVVQRLQYRFGEHYGYAFNPSVLQDDGRDLKKMLWGCWLELQRLLQSELSEELLATSLRLEKLIGRRLAGLYNAAVDAAAERLDGLQASEPELPELPTAELGAPWETDAVERRLLAADFKNPRHFFEGPGRGALRTALEARVLPTLQRHVEEVRERWLAAYKAHWNEQLQRVASVLRAEIETHHARVAASLESRIDPAELQRLLEALQRLRGAAERDR
ncbi:dynamin family protein, partial [Paenibacillus sp. IB182496]